MNEEYIKMWDTTVRPAAEEIIRTATVDKECIEEYVGGMIWATEHDIADGRCPGLNSLNRLMQIKGVFARTNNSYFEKIHPNTPANEIERMHRLSDLINDMIKVAKP